MEHWQRPKILKYTFTSFYCIIKKKKTSLEKKETFKRPIELYPFTHGTDISPLIPNETVMRFTRMIVIHGVKLASLALCNRSMIHRPAYSSLPAELKRPRRSIPRPYNHRSHPQDGQERRPSCKINPTQKPLYPILNNTTSHGAPRSSVVKLKGKHSKGNGDR